MMSSKLDGGDGNLRVCPSVGFGVRLNRWIVVMNGPDEMGGAGGGCGVWSCGGIVIIS
jgi:hypothetical protein